MSAMVVTRQRLPRAWVAGQRRNINLSAKSQTAVGSSQCMNMMAFAWNGVA